MFSRFSSISEAETSELLENLEKCFFATTWTVMASSCSITPTGVLPVLS